MEKQTIDIYCNYGVLGAEKRNVYTYGGEHVHATCSDKLTVAIPEGWTAHRNEFDSVFVSAPWKFSYQIGEVLKGNEHPVFEAYDKENKLHRYKLEIVEQ